MEFIKCRAGMSIHLNSEKIIGNTIQGVSEHVHYPESDRKHHHQPLDAHRWTRPPPIDRNGEIYHNHHPCKRISD